MLTVTDLMKRYNVKRETIANWYARRILPDGIAVGGGIRWREQDIRKFESYLRKRRKCRDLGGDPDGPRGPAPPVYSSGCPTFDPRAATARIEERERQAKSRTLARGTKLLPAEKQVEMPEPQQQPEGQKQ